MIFNKGYKIRIICYCISIILLITGCGSKPNQSDVEDSINKTFNNSVAISNLKFTYGDKLEDKYTKIYNMAFEAIIEFKNSYQSISQNFNKGEKYQIEHGGITFTWSQSEKKWVGGICDFLIPPKKIQN